MGTRWTLTLSPIMTTRTPKPPLDPSKTRPLAASIPKNGFTYELILRDGNYAIYQQRLRPGVGCLAFEVWHIQVEPEGKIMDKVVPQREVGPSNESFGWQGWSYPDLGRAKAKMRALIEADAKCITT
jgi:hypothetical protein